MGRITEAMSLSSWYDNGVLTDKRIIYLENDAGDPEIDRSEVSSIMTSRFIKSMCLLESIDDDKEITVLLHTIGGCEFSMFSIYDRIQESPCHVTVRGYGQIFSAGAVILQAGDTRQLTPNSWVMVHRGSNDVIDQSSQSILNWGSALDKINETMYKMFYDKMKLQDPKITMRKIRDMFKEDVVISADVAVKMGLADSIYTGDK